MIDQIFTYTETAPLTEAEEIDLIARAQAGDEEATLVLMHTYGPALRSAVSNFANGVRNGRDPWAGGDGLGTSAFTEEDARHAALVGFMEAIREHDATKNPRLAGTVRTRIARELADLFESVMPFTVPERTLSRFYGILKKADGDAEAAEALAPEHGMTRETFREVLAAVRGTGSLDETLGGDEDGPRPEVNASPVYTASPIVDVEDKILVEVAFAAVNDEEERICRLSYGFTDYEPVPDAEIAHRMGLTRPTVQRKRGKALDTMRKALGVTLAE